MSNLENNKRIAKNTILLYFRMFLTIGVALYTSRVVLNLLGIKDFGIYNIVGGIVIMFSFLNTSMSSATQRFLTYELGKEDRSGFNKVMSMSINIHAIIAVVIFILAETIGLWFLNYKLNIPADRIETANWVFQFSILSLIVNMASVPYNATIIANERMNFYAFLSVFEVMLKLALVFLLFWIGNDKLRIYAILIFFVYLIIFLIYKIYCNRNYPETKYVFSWDKALYQTLMKYAGWNLFGNIAGVCMNQGVNILLNLFFGPVVNASRAIAYQVNAAVNGFVTNFQTAMTPQIVKAYAGGDLGYMHQIICKGAKYSFFLLLLIALPFFLETELILRLWLKIVPEYSVLFCRLIIINMLMDCVSGPLMSAAQATGEIKLYQSVVGSLLFLTLPVSYVFLKLGFQPQVVFYVSICISIIALVSRLIILRPQIGLPIQKFLKEVLLLISLVSIAAIIIPSVIRYNLTEGLLRFFVVGAMSIVCTLASIYFLGLNVNERKFLLKNGLSVFGKS